MIIIRFFNYIKRLIWRITNVPFFGALGKKSFINSPLKLEGKKNIHIGNNVLISYKTWLASMPHTKELNPVLKIDDGTIIGNFNHIYATKSIYIGKNVLTADKVYISDNLHSFEDITIPIKLQPIKQLKEVTIGDGAWLGENVCVLGANIGKNSVIGANAVVTKDIPDYCVAIGAPAKVIKKYNHFNNTWERIV